MTDDLDRLVKWLQEAGVSEELGAERDLVVPSLGPGTIAVEPNIPLLGAVPLRRTEAGLLIPAEVPPASDDLVGAYLMASDFAGARLELDELVELIGGQPFSPLASKLAALNCIIEAEGVMNQEVGLTLLREICPPKMISRLRPLIDSGERVFTSPQVVLTALKLAIKHARRSGGGGCGSDDRHARSGGR